MPRLQAALPYPRDPAATTLPAAFARRTAVVTGAAGFIGSHLCERLLSLGAEVIGVDNLLTGRLDNLAGLRSAGGFRFQTDDVTRPFTVAGPVDFVFHLASPASPLDYARHPLATLKVGAMGTLNALELAETKHARFLLASTSEVYGDPLVHPQPEQYWGNVNPVGPRSVYDEAKRYAEALTSCFERTGSTRTRIVRIFNTYGPRMRADDGRAVPAFLQQALAGEPITVAGDGSQTRSLCFVSDTVEGLLAAATADYPGPVNLGNPDEITMLQLAEEIRAMTSSASVVTFVPLPTDDPKRRCPDITAARAHLGWEPTTHLRDGLRQTLVWAQKHFPLQAATPGRSAS
ncbi:SDR family oxidoreductase [Streptomyces kaniharaensis]|uniref:SDR family oxidoreductase n=1 Tax=Streptomyces kaniharaensis TaxID=212423 RepID=A0A6N7KPL3_9ACTN|nr:UDP-glucuronic acid decarboxylase family protein [Streptomyces kaniharaensis]MQS13371.1 SDR family oxidoreductase [Streptomyces kaniharaensis]